MTQTLSVGEGKGLLSFTLTRKNVKRINLRVHSDGSVHVSAPPSVPVSFVKSFVMNECALITKARKRFAEREAAKKAPLSLLTGETLPIHGRMCLIVVQQGAKRSAVLADETLVLTLPNPGDHKERVQLFLHFVREEARRSLLRMTQEVFPLFAPIPARLPNIKFRAMKTRWGVCRPTEGVITLNSHLIFVPEEYAKYVICHELAHFRHADHSPAFWQELTKRCPECRRLRKELNQFDIPRVLP